MDDYCNNNENKNTFLSFPNTSLVLTGLTNVKVKVNLIPKIKTPDPHTLPQESEDPVKENGTS